MSSRDTDAVLRYNAGTGAFLGSFVPSGEGGLSQPQGLAFGPDGKLYVAAAGTNQIFRYDGKTGAFLDVVVTQANNAGLSGPRGLVFGPDKQLYVSSFNTNQIIRYTLDAKTDLFAGSTIFATTGTAPGNDLSGPTSLAFNTDDNGNLYVASYNTNEVLRFTGANGTFLSSFLAPPTGGLTGPDGLVFGPNGNLFVGSNKTGAVYQFDKNTGVFLGTFVPPNSGALNGPAGLAFAPDGSLYVSSQNTNQVLHYTGAASASPGTFISSITPEPLAAPGDSTLGPDGYLYVVSQSTDSIVRYDPKTGQSLGTFVASGSAGLNEPEGIAFGTDVSGDGYSDLFVGNGFDNKVLVFNGKTGQPIAGLPKGTSVFVSGDPTLNGKLSGPQGLAFYQGNLYVTSSKTERVIEYSGTTGSLIGTFTPEPLDAPEGAVFGPNGDLFVASRDGNEVIEYDGKTGKFVKVFVSGNPALNGGLTQPRGITFDGNLLLVSSYATDQVLQYNATTGAYQGVFIPDPLHAPQFDAIGPDGNLYVTSRDGNEVNQYDGKTGAFLKSFIPSDPTLNGGLKAPEGILFANGVLYVSSHATNQVLKYNATTGALLGVFVNSGGELGLPEGLAVDASGNVYVGSQNTDEVLRYDSNGNPVGTGVFVKAGSGGLNGPEGLAFDSKGDLYVASNLTGQVLEYAAATGAFVRAYVASGANGLTSPVGIAFDSGGNLDVVSQGTNSVLRFAYDPVTKAGKALPGPGLKGASLVPSGESGIATPSGLVLDASGNLFVVGQANGQVFKYSATGQNVFTLPGVYGFTPPPVHGPDGLTINPTNNSGDGTLYVAGNTSGRIFRYDATTGAFLGYTDPEALLGPEEVVIGPNGNAYVASQTNNEVLEYDGKTGAFLGIFVAKGSGGLSSPKGMTFGPSGDNTLYVGSQGTGQILKFDATTGAYLGVFVDSGAVTVAPASPDGLIFGPDGNLYVSDSINGSVDRFDGKTGPPCPRPSRPTPGPPTCSRRTPGSSPPPASCSTPAASSTSTTAATAKSFAT